MQHNSSAVCNKENIPVPNGAAHRPTHQRNYSTGNVKVKIASDALLKGGYESTKSAQKPPLLISPRTDVGSIEDGPLAGSQPSSTKARDRDSFGWGKGRHSDGKGSNPTINLSLNFLVTGASGSAQKSSGHAAPQSTEKQPLSARVHNSEVK